MANPTTLPSPQRETGAPELYGNFTFSMEDIHVFESALRFHSIGSSIFPAMAFTEEDNARYLSLKETIDNEIVRQKKNALTPGTHLYILTRNSLTAKEGTIPLSIRDYHILVKVLQIYFFDLHRRFPGIPSETGIQGIFTRLHSAVALPFAIIEAEQFPVSTILAYPHQEGNP